MHDRYRNRYKVPKATGRARSQIALEAARRIYPTIAPPEDRPAEAEGWLDSATSHDLYVAKRKAAAVLGHRVRPGDLPSDDEVREHLVALWRGATSLGASQVEEAEDVDEPTAVVAALAEHLDRFAIYRMRLIPLEEVKQSPRHHPEGDALFHSLQVFELARDTRPYDEEFLLAALLHDVGKAIDPQNHARAGVESLRGALTERTLWLIAHHMDLLILREKGLSQRARREIEESEFFEDLRLLRELDDTGRVPGQVVGTIDEALEYLRRLEAEEY